jgi:hypothetical protein
VSLGLTHTAEAGVGGARVNVIFIVASKALEGVEANLRQEGKG